MAKKKRKSLSDVASEARQEAEVRPLEGAKAQEGSGTSAAALAVQRRQAEAEEPEPEPKPKRLNVDLHPDLYDRFKRRCQQEDRPMSEVVRDLVEAYLSV